MKISRLAPRGQVSKRRAMLAVSLAESPYLRAIWAPCRQVGDNETILEAPAAEYLGLREGEEVWVLPLQDSGGDSEHAR